ncbi:MAG: hypothetical protein COC05_07425 [Gammaproteobacteria bacterium]|nr:MAG: hypothetical protein COC05_07425 [Gammaproteobacteria bacterium]
MLSLRNLNIITATCAVMGIIVLLLTNAGPVTDNGIPKFLLLILMFSEFIAIAGIAGVIMAAKQIKLRGNSIAVSLTAASCVLFTIAFGAFGISIWRTYIDA